MSSFEPFTLVEEPSSSRLFDTFQEITSAKTADHDIQYLTALRRSFPEYVVTSIPAGNCNLLAFARSGHALAELDLETDSHASWRGWVPGFRAGQQGTLGENVFFAKYKYQWASETFVLYVVGAVQYVLKEPQPGENVLAKSSITDALIKAVGTWQSADQNVIWVFDTSFWARSKELYNQVEKAEWKNVILDEGMKKAVTDVSTKFFDGKDTYEDLGVPWKRGVIFYGPAGNGKTISIKALMHTLLRRKVPVPTLYVKAAPVNYSIRTVFTFARSMSPCLLVFEDIDTVVTERTRSYFFNEVDGLENNDGILMVASTNHLERLDPGITKRPSRFDRKYLFPLPSEHERVLYCEFWRQKLQKQEKTHVEFPKKLCPAIAAITKEFSFAYLQEAFIASLLVIARDAEEESSARRDHHHNDSDDDELSRYRLWVVMKEQIKILREDMDSGDETSSSSNRFLAGEDTHGGLDVARHLAAQPQDNNALPDLGSSSIQQLPYGKARVFNTTAFALQ